MAYVQTQARPMLVGADNSSPGPIHRPQPRMAPSSNASVQRRCSPLDTVADAPLDLSARPCVIQAPAATAAAPSLTGSNFLPTCRNPSLNAGWIAVKFGQNNHHHNHYHKKNSLNSSNSSHHTAGPNRMSYPREFKLMVIDYYNANGQNKYRTCKEFQITKSMLNGWLQKIDKIKQSRPGSLKSGRSGRRPQFPDIEKQLFTLYHNHLGTGKKVGNRWIRDTARALARDQCSQQELTGMCQFSERWLSNFKKRYRINLNRDWTSSSGSSLGGSSESSIVSSPIAGGGSEETPAGTKLLNNEDSLLLNSDDDEEDGDGASIDIEDCMSSSSSSNCSKTEDDVAEIINKPGQLPIEAFYERFPWLCRRNTVNGEPGRRGRKVQFPQVERALYERVKTRQALGDRISNKWLQEQARQLAAQLCPQILADATKSARCMFSEHWLHNFKKRYGVTLKPALMPQPAVTAPLSGDSDTLPKATPHDAMLPPPPPAAPVTLSAMLQLQQWFLQQCYRPMQTLQHATAPGVWHAQQACDLSALNQARSLADTSPLKSPLTPTLSSKSSTTNAVVNEDNTSTVVVANNNSSDAIRDWKSHVVPVFGDGEKAIA